LQAFSADWNCGELVLMLLGSAGSTIWLLCSVGSGKSVNPWARMHAADLTALRSSADVAVGLLP
jgi:hypothetical protein